MTPQQFKEIQDINKSLKSIDKSLKTVSETLVKSNNNTNKNSLSYRVMAGLESIAEKIKAK